MSRHLASDRPRHKTRGPAAHLVMPRMFATVVVVNVHTQQHRSRKSSEQDLQKVCQPAQRAGQSLCPNKYIQTQAAAALLTDAHGLNAHMEPHGYRICCCECMFSCHGMFQRKLLNAVKVVSEIVMNHDLRRPETGQERWWLIQNGTTCTVVNILLTCRTYAHLHRTLHKLKRFTRTRTRPHANGLLTHWTTEFGTSPTMHGSHALLYLLLLSFSRFDIRRRCMVGEGYTKCHKLGQFYCRVLLEPHSDTTVGPTFENPNS